MQNCFEKHSCHCGICPIENCEKRKKDKNDAIANLKCDGNCFLCDGAFEHYSHVAGKITTSISTCTMYHLQTHHAVNFIKRIGETSNRTNIEIINDRISVCDTCPYSSICILISQNANWTVEDVKAHLNINWNRHNEGILEFIPKDKLYAFTICSSLQKQFKDLQIKSLDDYMNFLKNN